MTMLTDAAKRHPDRAYLAGKTDDGWIETSFSQAENTTDIIAAWLLDRKMSRGDRIALLAEGRPEWILAELGMLKAGMVSVPLSIKLMSEEIPFRLNHSRASALILSHVTLQKVIDCWDQIDRKPFLFLFDEPKEEQLTRFKEFGLDRVVHWTTYVEAMSAGEAVIDRQPSIVRDSVAAIDENDSVNICYTSGTTGNPKGIMLTHLNYWTNALDAVEHFGLPDGEYETLVILPLDHSFAHTVATYSGLFRAITLSFVDARKGAMSIIRNIPINMVERNPTFLLTVPSLSGNFMKNIVKGVAEKGAFVNGIFSRGIEAGIAINGDGFHKASFGVRLKNGFNHWIARKLVFQKVKKIFGTRIRFFVGGGAILEKKQQEFFGALGVPVYQGYGLTEAAPIISANTPGVHKFGTSGTVMPRVKCRIMKTETEEALAGEKGQIVVRADSVMKGYFENTEATDDTLRDGWLWSGDLGYYEEDGFLMVVGREKALLIAADGEKFPPETIEEAVTAHTNLINQIMVYNDQRKYTAALVTLDEDRFKEFIDDWAITTAGQALEKFQEEFNRYSAAVGNTVPNAWRPSFFEIIPDAFSEADHLINSTMKLVRYKVSEYYKDRIEAMYADEDNLNSRNKDAMAKLFGLENR